jgi:calnexin
MIPDPNATKPDDWDDNEDGEYTAPLIPNPACEKAGCGVWKAPMIKNPAYKGPWKAPLIKNPLYQGIWKPRKVSNPNYYEISGNIYPTLPSISGLAVEVWTISPGIVFDNFFVATSLEEAFQYSVETSERKVSYFA